MPKETIQITKEDKTVIENIATKNQIEVDEIIGLLMDGYLRALVKENEWECDYILDNGSPWKHKNTN